MITRKNIAVVTMRQMTLMINKMICPHWGRWFRWFKKKHFSIIDTGWFTRWFNVIGVDDFTWWFVI